MKSIIEKQTHKVYAGTMIEYFGIRYEFDIPSIHRTIEQHIKEGKSGYICVADGNILSITQKNKEYKKIINESLFSICDSSWVPIFIKWIYNRRYQQYCGADIFKDIVKSGKYRMIFLGGDKERLDALQNNLVVLNKAVRGMIFHELPFCAADEFDYKGIAEIINNDGAEIIWVSLGAPKQEIFMNKLKPHLRKGVIIAIGATFNFFCGLEYAPKRAPKWMIDNHMEFIYRIFQEPRKQIKRCFGIICAVPPMLFRSYKNRKQSRHIA